MSSAGRPKRRIRRRDYRDLADVKVPKAKRSAGCGSSGGLYPVNIVQEDGNRYKVHYVGYSSCYDEWKENEELVKLDAAGESYAEGDSRVEPFSLYNELSHRIKASLKSGRKESPIVKIEMPFDRVTFDGGLGVCGVPKRFIHGTQRYSISSFKDLNRLLGSNWHVRGINKNGDFCYVILNTAEFYLYHRRPLKEYTPTCSGNPVEVKIELGHALVFSFVRGDGTPDKFGKDRDIFCN